MLLIGRDGQPIADAGDVDNLDVTSLASLTAGNIAATGGMAKLLKENEFATQFHEGEKANIHIQLVGSRVILRRDLRRAVDPGPGAPAREEGVGRAGATHLRRSRRRRAARSQPSILAEITDEDIDNLFND